MHAFPTHQIPVGTGPLVRGATGLVVALLALGSLAACEAIPIPIQPVTTVREGPEPNSTDPGHTPTAVSAALPVRVAGTFADAADRDAFVLNLGAGTLEVTSCQGAAGVSLNDDVGGTTGGCGSRLALHTLGGAVTVIVFPPSSTPATYTVQLEFTPDL